MTVKELIEKLQLCDPEAKVITHHAVIGFTDCKEPIELNILQHTIHETTTYYIPNNNGTKAVLIAGNKY